MTPAAAARELQEELWEEIFLRLPPDDPASFLRASLVCKTWRRIVSRPGFLRCLGELHRVPPILGFFRNSWNEGFGFVPTTASAFSLPIPIPIPERRSWGVVDCRHGRVLLRSRRSAREFLVWEPMTGYQRRLPDWSVKSFFMGSFNAAVMCAAVGCGHWNCHGGPFRVVAVYTVAVNNNEHPMWFTSACVYSSETGAWGEPTSPVGTLYGTVATTGSTLVGNSLYIQCVNEVDIFKYDIREHTLVALAIGEDVSDLRGSRLTQAEDGELRFVNVYDTILWLCPWDEDRGWVDTRLIRLKDVLPPVATAALTDLSPELNPVVGFVEGASIIFLYTNDDIYMIDPNSAGQARKVCSTPLDYNWVPFDFVLFPFTSFYIPPGGQHDARE